MSGVRSGIEFLRSENEAEFAGGTWCIAGQIEELGLSGGEHLQRLVVRLNLAHTSQEALSPPFPTECLRSDLRIVPDPPAFGHLIIRWQGTLCSKVKALPGP